MAIVTLLGTQCIHDCWFYVLATWKRLFEPFAVVLINKIMVSMIPTWICRLYEHVWFRICICIFLYWWCV